MKVLSGNEQYFLDKWLKEEKENKVISSICYLFEDVE